MTDFATLFKDKKDWSFNRAIKSRKTPSGIAEGTWYFHKTENQYEISIELSHWNDKALIRIQVDSIIENGRDLIPVLQKKFEFDNINDKILEHCKYIITKYQTIIDDIITLN